MRHYTERRTGTSTYGWSSQWEASYGRRIGHCDPMMTPCRLVGTKGGRTFQHARGIPQKRNSAAVFCVCPATFRSCGLPKQSRQLTTSPLPRLNPVPSNSGGGESRKTSELRAAWLTSSDHHTRNHINQPRY